MPPGPLLCTDSRRMATPAHAPPRVPADEAAAAAVPAVRWAASPLPLLPSSSSGGGTGMTTCSCVSTPFLMVTGRLQSGCWSAAAAAPLAPTAAGMQRKESVWLGRLAPSGSGTAAEPAGRSSKPPCCCCCRKEAAAEVGLWGHGVGH